MMEAGGRPPFSVVYEERGPYLDARVSGSVDTIPTSLAYWKEIAEECRRRGFRRVLVIEMFETAAPLMDVYEVAKQLPPIIRGIKVAFVDVRLDELEANKFGEDVAVNRGAFGKVFSNEASAIEWLTAGAH